MYDVLREARVDGMTGLEPFEEVAKELSQQLQTDEDKWLAGK
jgi:hypothetical protein